jgi:hypothetical protein
MIIISYNNIRNVAMEVDGPQENQENQESRGSNVDEESMFGAAGRR